VTLKLPSTLSKVVSLPVVSTSDGLTVS
jgi:hypothetical protein